MGGTSSSESAVIMSRPKRPVTCLASALPLAPSQLSRYPGEPCWGLICGFEVLLPYWYVCFFVPMIIHRAVRDDARCAEKYGADWDTYIRRVPYVFVPGLV